MIISTGRSGSRLTGELPRSVTEWEHVFIQAHEPASSAAVAGGAREPFLIQGWTGLVMPHWYLEKVDHVEPIVDADALDMTSRLAHDEGIFAGISTGATVVGAHWLAERLGSDAVIVTIAVDTGFKYLSVSTYHDLYPELPRSGHAQPAAEADVAPRPGGDELRSSVLLPGRRRRAVSTGCLVGHAKAWTRPDDRV